MSKGCTLGQAKGSHTAIIGGGERTLPNSTSGRVDKNQLPVRVNLHEFRLCLSHERRCPIGIMLELCELLKINVNELLSGERIMAEAYDKRAEENLLAMRREVEEKNRQMLQTEYWIAIPAVIAGLIMVFVASFLEMPVWLRIALIVFALIMIFTVAFIAVGIEQKAGYYECQNCHHRYVPTYWQTNLAMHMGRTRYMKCPKCGKRSWQKKVLTKEE